MLLLSSSELQDQYHIWMDKTPAVACSIYFPPLFHLFGALTISSKDVDGLQWLCFHGVFASHGPWRWSGWPWISSAPPSSSTPSPPLFLWSTFVTVGTGLMALNDPCTLSLGPGWMSPAGYAMFVALETATHFATTPCTMQHLPALCVIVGPGSFLACYIRSQRRHGGLGLISYPYHYVELGIIIAAAKTAALLVGAAVRYSTRTRKPESLPWIVQAPHALTGVEECEDPRNMKE